MAYEGYREALETLLDTAFFYATEGKSSTELIKINVDQTDAGYEFHDCINTTN